MFREIQSISKHFVFLLDKYPESVLRTAGCDLWVGGESTLMDLNYHFLDRLG